MIALFSVTRLPVPNSIIVSSVLNVVASIIVFDPLTTIPFPTLTFPPTVISPQKVTLFLNSNPLAACISVKALVAPKEAIAVEFKYAPSLAGFVLHLGVPFDTDNKILLLADAGDGT